MALLSYFMCVSLTIVYSNVERPSSNCYILGRCRADNFSYNVVIMLFAFVFHDLSIFVAVKLRVVLLSWFDTLLIISRCVVHLCLYVVMFVFV